MSNDVKFNFSSDKLNVINSQEFEDNKNVKNFLNYLNEKNVSLSIIKFLISLKNSNTLPTNPIDILKDYYSVNNDDSWNEIQELEVNIENFKNENQDLKKEIIIWREKLETKKSEYELQKNWEEENLNKEQENKIKKSKKI